VLQQLDVEFVFGPLQLVFLDAVGVQKSEILLLKPHHVVQDVLVAVDGEPEQTFFKRGPS